MLHSGDECTATLFQMGSWVWMRSLDVLTMVERLGAAQVIWDELRNGAQMAEKTSVQIQRRRSCWMELYQICVDFVGQSTFFFSLRGNWLFTSIHLACSYWSAVLQERVWGFYSSLAGELTVIFHIGTLRSFSNLLIWNFWWVWSDQTRRCDSSQLPLSSLFFLFCFFRLWL